MPLPWLIGAVAVAAAAAIVKAVSDDSPSSSSSSTTTYDDSDRREQEQEAKLGRDRDALKKRIAGTQQTRRSDLKSQLRLAAATLPSATDDAKGFARMTGLTLEGISGDVLEQKLGSTASSDSAYARTLKDILKAAPGVKASRVDKVLKGVNLLESVTDAVDAPVKDRATQAAIHSANARIERLQKLKNQLLSQV
ncbi:MAG: hypothetical protein LBJ37_04140 [Paucimonas sp.]|jgi:hypothetical protein|nr:hypothetical protein [Paucimonas sp.]